MKKFLLMQAGLFIALLTIHAQPSPPVRVDVPLPAYQPTRVEIMDRYHKARYLDSIATRSIFKATVRPHWSADNGSFWYRNFLKDSVKEYISVDVVHGARTELDAEPADTTTRHTGFQHYTGRRWASFSTDSLSPDKKWVAYIQNGNVCVRPAKSDG